MLCKHYCDTVLILGTELIFYHFWWRKEGWIIIIRYWWLLITHVLMKKNQKDTASWKKRVWEPGTEKIKINKKINYVYQCKTSWKECRRKVNQKIWKCKVTINPSLELSYHISITNKRLNEEKLTTIWVGNSKKMWIKWMALNHRWLIWKKGSYWGKKYTK